MKNVWKGQECIRLLMATFLDEKYSTKEIRAREVGEKKKQSQKQTWSNLRESTLKDVWLFRTKWSQAENPIAFSAPLDSLPPRPRPSPAAGTSVCAPCPEALSVQDSPVVQQYPHPLLQRGKGLLCRGVTRRSGTQSGFDNWGRRRWNLRVKVGRGGDGEGGGGRPGSWLADATVGAEPGRLPRPNRRGPALCQRLRGGAPAGPGWRPLPQPRQGSRAVCQKRNP